MKVNSRLASLLIGILAIIIGIVMLVITKNNEKRFTETVSATVVEYREEEQQDADGNWSTSYVPVFSYEVAGKSYTEPYSQSYAKRKFPEGDAVTLCYDPEDPAEFWVEGDNRTLVSAAWVIPVGILLVLYSGVVTAIRKRR